MKYCFYSQTKRFRCHVHSSDVNVNMAPSVWNFFKLTAQYLPRYPANHTPHEGFHIHDAKLRNNRIAKSHCLPGFLIGELSCDFIIDGTQLSHPEECADIRLIEDVQRQVRCGDCTRYEPRLQLLSLSHRTLLACFVMCPLMLLVLPESLLMALPQILQ